MTTTRSLSIKRNGVGHEVLVDGHDLSHALQGLTLHMRAGQISKAELEMNVFDVSQAGDVEVQLVFGRGVKEALIALGWTPPVADRNGDGD